MRRAWRLALAIGCCAPFAPIGGVPVEGQAMHEAAPSILDPDGCVGCHEEETAAWSSSLHASASVDPVYLAEHGGGRDPFCTGCHDPRGEDRGVDCATCHLEDGVIVAPHASGRAPHPTRVVTERATPSACAGCHDFDFPRVPGQPMQDTVDEWRASEAPACQRCHMPEGDHAFVARRDPSFASGAIEVSVRARARARSTRVLVTLENHAGHAVPTGDVFRRLTITVTAGSATRTVSLGRRFHPEHGELVETRDDRLAPRERRTVVVTLPVAAERAAWSVAIEAVTAERARALGLADPEWRTELANGETVAR